MNGYQPSAKSLFPKILAVSPCVSRFCLGLYPIPTHKFFAMRILGEQRKKIPSTWQLSRHANLPFRFGAVLPDNLKGDLHVPLRRSHTFATAD